MHISLWTALISHTVSFMAVWSVLWWVTFFLALPFLPSASRRLKPILWITTIVSLLLSLLIYTLFATGTLTLRKILGVV